MNLASYGIYPYLVGKYVRYFIKGIHGNFHVGSTDHVIPKMNDFFTAHGGLMKILNFHGPSENSDFIFSRYGCRELLFDKKSREHPFEQWGIDYYHPQFEYLESGDLKALLFFRKKEVFLFLDESITFRDQSWECVHRGDELRKLVGNYKDKVSAVLSMTCKEGRAFHQVSATILENKFKSLGD